MGKLLRAVTTLVLLLAVHASAAQSTTPGQEIVGAWAIDVRPDALPPDAPPLHTITVFDRGYGVTGVIDRLLPPIPPIQAVANEIGPMLGLWRRTGGDTFEFTIHTVMMRNGIVTGYHRVRNSVTVIGDQLSGTAYAEFSDLAGNLLLPVGTSAINGKRLDN